MTAQLGFYERPVPVSQARHGGWSIRRDIGFGFAARINAAPLMTVEFAQAAAHMPIVFSVEDGAVMPVAVVGLEQGRNGFVAANGSWRGDYIPASIRRYPFALSVTPGEGTLTLCVDEACGGLDPTGAAGDRLFGDDGAHTARLEEALRFTVSLQQEHERTRAFAQELHDLGVLEPAKATVTAPDGAVRTVTGFHHVDRAKLNALPDETVKAMLVAGTLDLVMLHLQSLSGFTRLLPKAE